MNSPCVAPDSANHLTSYFTMPPPAPPPHRPNVEVLTALLNGAVRSVDVQRALAAMEAFVTHQVQPDRRALMRLEELRLRLQTLLVDRVRRGGG